MQRLAVLLYQDNSPMNIIRKGFCNESILPWCSPNHQQFNRPIKNIVVNSAYASYWSDIYWSSMPVYSFPQVRPQPQVTSFIYYGKTQAKPPRTTRAARGHAPPSKPPSFQSLTRPTAKTWPMGRGSARDRSTSSSNLGCARPPARPLQSRYGSGASGFLRPPGGARW